MRKILITGGTGVIGAQLVEDMIKDGHYVIFTSRSLERGYELIKKLKLGNDRCIPIELDFGDKECLENLKTQLKELPDAVIHNARSLHTLRIQKTGIVPGEQFQDEFFNGVTLPYEINNLLIRLDAPLRDVIFISSMYGSVAPNPSLYDNFKQQSPINYGVVKAAQIHLVKELAVRLASKGIRANAISYGGVEGRADEKFKQRYGKLAPTGRMLNLNDLYPPIQYVLNNIKLNMTGENIKVDGGWTLW